MTGRIRLRRLLAAGLCATALTAGALTGITPAASASTSAALSSTATITSAVTGTSTRTQAGSAVLPGFADAAISRENVVTSGGTQNSDAVAPAAATYCSFGSWGGGGFCGTGATYTMPNGYKEIFIIGLDNAVWTRWNSPSGLSSWVSLSGYCINTGSPLGLGNVSGYDTWTWYVNCTGSDGHPWYITRYGSDNGTGTWTNWQSPPQWAPTLQTGTCSFEDWGGGGFCGTNATYTMPNGYEEIFIIGLDHAVWTRWNSSSGLSSWVSLSGYCINTGSPLGLGNVSGYDTWTWYVNCTGSDGDAWYITRFGSDDGTGNWNQWTTTTP